MESIKNFFKEYNSLINEMDKLYNAEKAKDMEPLTDEEKEEYSIQWRITLQFIMIKKL